MSHGRVAEIAAQADRLPSLPAVVSRLIALMADDRLGIETLAHQVEADPASAAPHCRILKDVLPTCVVSCASDLTSI